MKMPTHHSRACPGFPKIKCPRPGNRNAQSPAISYTPSAPTPAAESGLRQGRRGDHGRFGGMGPWVSSMSLQMRIVKSTAGRSRTGQAGYFCPVCGLSCPDRCCVDVTLNGPQHPGGSDHAKPILQNIVYSDRQQSKMPSIKTHRIAAGRRSVTLNGSKTDPCSAHPHIGTQQPYLIVSLKAPIGRACPVSQLSASGFSAAGPLQHSKSRGSIRSDA